MAGYWNAPSVCARLCNTFFIWCNGIISNMARHWGWIMLNATRIMMWSILRGQQRLRSRRCTAALCGSLPLTLPCVFRSHAAFLSFRPISLHSNEAYALITAIIGDNAVVCLQMKAAEMRGRLNATEKRSSEPFNLFYWSPSNVTPIDYQHSDKQTRVDTTEFHLPSRARKHQLTLGSMCVYDVQLDIYQIVFKLDTALSSWGLD